MRAYFYCVEPGTADRSGYEHGLVALAEGLVELGHEVAGVRPYWSVGDQHRIPRTEEDPRAFDVVLVSHEWFFREGRLPEVFQSKKGPQRVYLDLSDGWTTPACTDRDWPADWVLRAHYNDHFRYAPRVRPWAFGLTQRILDATQGGEPAEQRSPVVSCNFRVGHPVRDRLSQRFRRLYADAFSWDGVIDTQPPTGEQEHLWWVATGRRHNPNYFERLKRARVSLAFGGFFAPGWASAQDTFAGRLGYHGIQRLGLATATLTQFDSWRFWESLAAGCLTVHGPLDRWGARLPIQPVAGLHYWSFDGKASVNGGSEGRAWAREHYSPRAQAARFLEFLS